MKAVHEHPEKTIRMAGPPPEPAGEARRLLVERIASSNYLKRSARLREMFLYVSGRVLDGHVEQIHEQEVGYQVFGRPADYDTATDNIVRVNASILRKRLDQYFAAEGAAEPLVIEIPKGNYAPVFHERVEVDASSARRTFRRDWRLWVLGGAAALFACAAVLLWLRRPSGETSTGASAAAPSVRLFWSQVFRPNQTTDIVLDDAAVELYQELSDSPLSLSDYFDRDYLRTLGKTALAAKLRDQFASTIVLSRQTSYSSASFLWMLARMPGVDRRNTAVYFARDYSFRALKTDDAVLLGNSRSNPWVQLFEGRVGLRWTFDPAAGVYRPVDTQTHSNFPIAAPGETHAGYCAVLLLPNLSGNGNVLIISGTGGRAIDAAAGFLASGQGVSELRRHLPAASNNRFPYFEALLRVAGRRSTPRAVTVALCRAPRQ